MVRCSLISQCRNTRALDSVIAHGSALLAGAINRALQPRLSVAQLFWLAG